MVSMRVEVDSFGPIEVPADALWGAQTERSRRFFAIGRQRMPIEIVHALAEVKRAAAGSIATWGCSIPPGPRRSPRPRPVWRAANSIPSFRCPSGRPDRARRAT